MTRSLSQFLAVAAALSLAACAEKDVSRSSDSAPMTTPASSEGSSSATSSSATGTGATASTGAGSSSMQSSQDSTQMMFERVQMIHAMEIQAGKMAKERASSQKVKDYGDRLVRDHEQGQQRLQQLAKEKGITLAMEPTMMRGMDASASKTGTSGSGSMATGSTTGSTGTNATGATGSTDSMNASMPADMQESMAAMERLKTMKGKEFDTAFMQQMVKDHEKALMMVQSFQPRVQGDAAVQQELQTLTTSMKSHRDMAQTIVTSLGGTSTDRVNTSGSQKPATPAPTTQPQTH